MTMWLNCPCGYAISLRPRSPRLAARQVRAAILHAVAHLAEVADVIRHLSQPPETP